MEIILLSSRQRNVVQVLAESITARGIGLLVCWSQCRTGLFFPWKTLTGRPWLVLAVLGKVTAGELEIRETANWLVVPRCRGIISSLITSSQHLPPPHCQLHLMTCSIPVSQSTIKLDNNVLAGGTTNCKYLLVRLHWQSVEFSEVWCGVVWCGTNTGQA